MAKCKQTPSRRGPRSLESLRRGGGGGGRAGASGAPGARRRREPGKERGGRGKRGGKKKALTVLAVGESDPLGRYGLLRSGIIIKG